MSSLHSTHTYCHVGDSSFKQTMHKNERFHFLCLYGWRSSTGFSLQSTLDWQNASFVLFSHRHVLVRCLPGSVTVLRNNNIVDNKYLLERRPNEEQEWMWIAAKKNTQACGQWEFYTWVKTFFEHNSKRFRALSIVSQFDKFSIVASFLWVYWCTKRQGKN